MDTHTMATIMYSIVGLWGAVSIIVIIATHPKTEEAPKKTIIPFVRKDIRFNQNEEFCPYCLTNDYWYRGGGSWSPDRCPFHPKSDDFILWKQMSKGQRNKAAKRFDDMWHEKYGNHYFKED